MRIRAFWNRLPMFVQMIIVGVANMALIVLFFSTMGCQARVTFETNGYYPDRTGDKRVGDPRRPMFEGSGYAEDEGRTSPSSDYSKHFSDRADD